MSDTHYFRKFSLGIAGKWGKPAESRILQNISEHDHIQNHI